MSVVEFYNVVSTDTPQRQSELLSRIYLFTVFIKVVHIIIGRIPLSVCLSVCNAVHCGSQGWFTGLKLVPVCS